MIRYFDIFLSLLGIVLLSPAFVIVFIVLLFESGSPVFSQKRMGRNKTPFILIKFRTMSLDTVSVATHLLDRSSVTTFGNFLRNCLCVQSQYSLLVVSPSALPE